MVSKRKKPLIDNSKIYVHSTRSSKMDGSWDGIIDISSKPKVRRTAKATGILRLSKEAIDIVKNGRTSKGDVREASTVAAIQAVKETSRMIPHCHAIPIEGCNIKWELEGNALRCNVSVVSHWNTGVEMEALCGVSAGLLCAWDMLKSIEKNSFGQYPDTGIEGIRVLEKNKQQPHN